MAEYQCESCGALYTLEAGSIPPAMVCTCKNRSFKVAKSSILRDAN